MSFIQQILFHITLFVYSCQDVADFCNYYLQTFRTRQCSNDSHLLFDIFIYALSKNEGLFIFSTKFVFAPMICEYESSLYIHISASIGFNLR